MKRRSEHFKIDFPYLLKQNTLVTEKEYQALFQIQSHQQYLSSFYNKNLYEFYNKYSESVWFKSKYLEKHENYGIESQIILLNVDENLGYSELKNKLQTVPGFKSFNIIQRDNNDDFKRDIEVTTDGNIEDNVEFIKGLHLCETIQKVSDIKIKENQTVEYSNMDLKNIKNIFKMISTGKFYNKELIFVESENKNIQFDSEINEILNNNNNKNNFEKNKEDFLKLNSYLRNNFSFCYYCIHLYDTNFDMKRRCGSEHLPGNGERSLFERKINVLLQNKNIKLKLTSVDQELDKVIVKRREIFACDVCNKAFETADYVKNHFKKKHQEDYQKMEQKNTEYLKFLKNVDFLIFKMIEGLNLNFVPIFLENLKTVHNLVKYDLKHWFSGEIRIKK